MDGIRGGMADWLIEGGDGGDIFLTHLPTNTGKLVDGPVDMEMLLRLINNWQ